MISYDMLNPLRAMKMLEGDGFMVTLILNPPTHAPRWIRELRSEDLHEHAYLLRSLNEITDVSQVFILYYRRFPAGNCNHIDKGELSSGCVFKAKYWHVKTIQGIHSSITLFFSGSKRSGNAISRSGNNFSGT